VASAFLLLFMLGLGAGVVEMMSGSDNDDAETDDERPTEEPADGPVDEPAEDPDDETEERVTVPPFSYTVTQPGEQPVTRTDVTFLGADLSDPDATLEFDFGDAEGYIHIVRWNAETGGATWTNWFTELGIFYSESAELPETVWEQWDPDNPFPTDEDIANVYDPTQAVRIGSILLGSGEFDPNDTISDDSHFLNDDRRFNDDPDIDFGLPIATVVENLPEYSYLDGYPAVDFPEQAPELFEVTVDIPESEGGGTEENWDPESVLLHDDEHGIGFEFIEEFDQIVHVVDLNSFTDLRGISNGFFLGINSDLESPDVLVMVSDSTDPPLELGPNGWRLVGEAETVSVVKGGSDVRDLETSTDFDLNPLEIVFNVPVVTHTYQSLTAFG